MRSLAHQACGFTLMELLIATMLTMAVMGAVLGLVNAAQGAFQVQGDLPDMHQRLRASIDMMTADLRKAGGVDAAIRPYRVGGARDDAAAGTYYRTDTITSFYDGASVTYSLRSDAASGTFDLMQYDGRLTDLPVVDHVMTLAFEYFGDDRDARLDPSVLVDGPWLRDSSARPFDADLLRVRSVGIRLRLRSALGVRLVPDMEIQFRVARRSPS